MGKCDMSPSRAGETGMKGGWFRFWRNGPGIAWKPKDAPLLFSERNGYTRSMVIGRWRVKWLKR
jgi:hypothetical protein